MKIEMWPIGRVKPYANNPRVNDAGVAAVARSIEEFDWQQPIVAERHAVFEFQFLLEPLLPEPERGFGPRRQVVFEVVDVGLDGRSCLGRRVGEVAEDVQVVERRKGTRKIGLDESQDAPPGLETDLDVDARAVLDVVLRGLDEAWHLSQL